MLNHSFKPTVPCSVVFCYNARHHSGNMKSMLKLGANATAAAVYTVQGFKSPHLTVPPPLLSPAGSGSISYHHSSLPSVLSSVFP